ncbi:hypothetical protein [Nocardiopsis protaetiae]|uniref:hypothetical protein n=1 Tax=Nocardiopsis protaetiae TaxID=3382270 RepID=UPI00387A99B6
MDAFLAAVLFGAAWWINKQHFRKSGLIALVIAFGGSMLLYRSPASLTILGWANDTLIGALSGIIGGMLGDPLPTTVVWAVICIAGFAVTVMDLWKNHNYNAAAIFALVITPIAAHGAGSGALPALIDGLHTAGAGLVSGIIGGVVGS